MINEKNVIIMKIPYPMINGGLALKPHMYICKKSQSTNHEFIKCQTLKPYMLTSNIMQHYWDFYRPQDKEFPSPGAFLCRDFFNLI